MKSPIERVYDALEKHCDMTRYWNHPEFHCFEQFPPLVRIWPVTQAIESQLSNGGLGQLLWNTFANWRKLLERAVEAYRWLQLPSHVEGIQEFQVLFDKYEPICESHLSQYKLSNDFGEFRKWLTFANESLRSDKLQLFCDYPELEERKAVLLREHLKEILSEIKAGGNGRR